MKRTKASKLDFAPVKKPKLNTFAEKEEPEYVKNLREKGWAVVPNVITAEKAEEYASRLWDWVEQWETVDRNDPESWEKAKWPASTHGIFQFYGIGHQQFLWDARCEPKIIKLFADIWGTDELLVSFDGANISRPSIKKNKNHPWPHVDQTPDQVGFQCVQGLLNLKPCGPEDGGLTIYEGSHKLYDPFFAEKKKGEKISKWYRFKEEDLDYFKSCPPIKTTCNPGDFLIWDSRMIHFAQTPNGDHERMAYYICMQPRSFADPKDIEKKKKAYQDLRTCAHWPAKTRAFPKDPSPFTFGRQIKKEDFPVEKKHPELTDVGKRLAGLIPYPKKTEQKVVEKKKL